MPVVSAKLPGRQVKCPHCWGSFFTRSEMLYVGEDGGFHPPRLVQNWDNPRDLQGKPFSFGRACPHCRQPVSSQLLETQSVFISIVGTPSSGKTYLLASMYQRARDQLSKRYNRAISFPGVSGELVNRYFDKLFDLNDQDELVDLPKTQEGGVALYSEIKKGQDTYQYPKPFTMRMTNPLRREDAFAVVAYDNAGESFTKAVNLDSHVKSIDHLEDCDMILVVIDPVQIPSLAQELRAKGVQDPQLDNLGGTKQDDMLSGVIERTIGLRGTEQSVGKTPVCVVVQKWDMLREAGMIPDLPRIDPNMQRQAADLIPLFDEDPINIDPETNEAYVDLEELQAISIVVREMIRKYEPNIIHTLDSNFRTVRYFAASALGSSPEIHPVSNKLCFRPKNVNPFRVTDPLLWLLTRFNVLEGAGASLHSTGYERATRARQISSNRFQIQSPEDQTVWIDVDRDYIKNECMLPDMKGEGWFVVPSVNNWVKAGKTRSGATLYDIQNPEDLASSGSSATASELDVGADEMDSASSTGHQEEVADRDVHQERSGSDPEPEKKKKRWGLF